MTDQRSIRASDQDRERVAEVLRGAFAAGCLDSGELGQRSGAAYRARTLGELSDLTADLPGRPLEPREALPVSTATDTCGGARRGYGHGGSLTGTILLSAEFS